LTRPSITHSVYFPSSTKKPHLASSDIFHSLSLSLSLLQPIKGFTFQLKPHPMAALTMRAAAAAAVPRSFCRLFCTNPAFPSFSSSPPSGPPPSARQMAEPSTNLFVSGQPFPSQLFLIIIIVIIIIAVVFVFVVD